MRRTGALLICLAAGTAVAEPPTSPIADSNYSIELYDGVAYGNAAVVGMGGAAVANAIGTAGTLWNASAPAVRMTTDRDAWSWDYHLDAVAGTSNDYDNNGFDNAYDNNVVGTAGLGGRYHDWAAAVTATWQQIPIDDTTTSSTNRVQIAGARWLRRLDTAVGASISIGELAIDHDTTDPMTGDVTTTRQFGVSGVGLDAGATWVPSQQSVRVGMAVASPIRGVNVGDCDPSVCTAGMLPESIVSAWRLSTGVAYRFAGTSWNQLVAGYFRDEKALTLTGDVVVTGPTENAYGLEAYSTLGRLQRSGRHHAVSVRGGLEYEWKPGRLRLRAGSYWEPGRFVGVPGRLHVTVGIELRVFEFNLWSKPRRGRISLTSDGASHYANGGLSIGFWH